MIFVVPGLSRVTVPAAVAGVPGAIADVEFAWPRALFCTGILVLPADGTPETLAGLSVGVTDAQHNRPLVTDRRGRTVGLVQPFVMGCLALAGRAFHPFGLQKPVKVHDRWLITLKNFTGGTIDVASTALFFEELKTK